MDPVQILDELVPALVADVELDRETRARIGRTLLAVERVVKGSPDGWTLAGVTSFGQFCERRLNLPSGEGWQLLAAALACEKSTDLAKRVRDGDLNLAKAAALGPVLEHVQGKGDDEEQKLLDLATAGTTKAARDEASRLKEEARLKERPTPVTLHLSRKGLDDLGRTRDILTDRRGGPRPSESQAVETALDFFVDRNCPEKKAARAAERARKRKEREAAGGAKARKTSSSPPSRPPAPQNGSEDPGGNGRPSRYLPAADRHTVILRFGDRCFVEDCEVRHAGQFAHRKAYRFRGATKDWNVDRPCKGHHKAFDSGQLRLIEGPNGLPLIVDRRGRVVGRVRRPEPP